MAPPPPQHFTLDVIWADKVQPAMWIITSPDVTDLIVVGKNLSAALANVPPALEEIAIAAAEKLNAHE